MKRNQGMPEWVGRGVLQLMLGLQGDLPKMEQLAAAVMGHNDWSLAPADRGFVASSDLCGAARERPAALLSLMLRWRLAQGGVAPPAGLA